MAVDESHGTSRLYKGDHYNYYYCYYYYHSLLLLTNELNPSSCLLRAPSPTEPALKYMHEWSPTFNKLNKSLEQGLNLSGS